MSSLYKGVLRVLTGPTKIQQELNTVR